MFSTFSKQLDNIPAIFYLAILSYFVKSPRHTLELFSLMESVYELNFQGRGYVLVDFYFQRAEEFQKRFMSQGESS